MERYYVGLDVHSRESVFVVRARAEVSSHAERYQRHPMDSLDYRVSIPSRSERRWRWRRAHRFSSLPASSLALVWNRL